MAGALALLIGNPDGVPLSITVSNTSASGSHTLTSLTTPTLSPIITGGIPAFTYAWVYVSGESFTINSPSGAATTFTQPIMAAGTYVGTYRCTVTDAASKTGTQTFTVTMTRT